MLDRLTFVTTKRTAAHLRKTPIKKEDSSKRSNHFALKRTLGNRRFSALLQTKLAVSQPGDAYEREADRVAEKVTSIPDSPQLQKKCTGCPLGAPCPDCNEKRDIVISRKIQKEGQGKANPYSFGFNFGNGRPLEPASRTYFEPRFGYDFRHVRVHTDMRAMEAADSLDARAFTIGSNIVFGQGQYSFSTIQGRQLLAHELTHVVHQAGKNRKLQPANRDAGPHNVQQRKVITKWVPSINETLTENVIQKDTVSKEESIDKSINKTCFDGSQVVAIKNGKKFRCDAFTSSDAPTPVGLYCIRKQGEAQVFGGWRGLFNSRSNWYLLEPQFSTPRFKMNLHPGSRSTGCVTIGDNTCFKKISSVLNGPGMIPGFGYDGLPPGNKAGKDGAEIKNEGREVSCVSMLEVSTEGSCR